MKQGSTKRQLPKDKHTKASWKKRDESRKVNQQVYAANLLQAATDADEHDGFEGQGDPNAEARASENA